MCINIVGIQIRVSLEMAVPSSMDSVAEYVEMLWVFESDLV